jgi:hypothetical protein
MGILRSFWKLFRGGSLPKVVVSFGNKKVVLLEVRRDGSDFSIARQAEIFVPSALMRPSFSGSNIAEPKTLAELIGSASKKAGFGSHLKWSVVLPEGVAKSTILNFETGTREELKEMVSWRMERVVGVEAGRLRLSQQEVEGKYLVTAVEEEVICEYEKVFEELGWEAGMIVPRHIGEIVWLEREKGAMEKVLISHNESGFIAVVMRAGELLQIRSCVSEERENDLFRFAAYYFEKIARARSAKVLVIGSREEVAMTEESFREARGECDIEVTAESRYGDIAAAAAIGSMGC